MALDTLAAARAQFLDNCEYDAHNSASECRAFITACRALVLLIPARVGQGGGKEIEVEIGEIRQQQQAAQAWLASHPDAASSGVVYPDFHRFRG